MIELSHQQYAVCFRLRYGRLFRSSSVVSCLGRHLEIITCALNIGLFLCPLTLGVIKSAMEWGSHEKVTKKSKALYFFLSLYLMFLCSQQVVLVLAVVSICGLLASMWVWYLDFKGGSQLELTCILKTTHKSSTMYLGSKKRLTSLRFSG